MVTVALPNGVEWFEAVAVVMGRFGGRPRLGSVVNLGAPDVAPLYPRWAEWHALRRRLDPGGRLSNQETDRVLGPVR